MFSFPMSTAEKLLKNAGAKRVSESAKRLFSDVLSEITLQLITRACMLAKHAGRKTVTKEDILLAKQEIWGY